MIHNSRKLLKNELLKNYISMVSYDRGHSAGEQEVESIANEMAYDLQKVDDYITGLEQQCFRFHCAG
jgi:hypothetical protein